MYSIILFSLYILASLLFSDGIIHPIPSTSSSSSSSAATVQSDGTTNIQSNIDNNYLTIPSLPLQFRANITIIAHLVDKVSLLHISIK